MNRFAIVLGGALSLIAADAHAVLITFDGETLGARPNGFSVAGAPEITFSDSVGADLAIDNFSDQCLTGGSVCLATNTDDDKSGLVIDFATDASGISFVFGNDTLTGGNDVSEARLFLLRDGAIVATTAVTPNLDDIGNQTIAFADIGTPFDQAQFFYLGANGQPASLIELIDNLDVTFVPVPAALPLLATAVAGLGWAAYRRRG